MRESDTVARYGGDEFVILLTSVSGIEDAMCAADRISKLLAVPFEVRDRNVDLRASVGMAVYPTDGDDCEGLLQAADKAMYEAKRERR